MKRLSFAIIGVFILVFSSCNLLSLYPLYTDDVLVTDDRLSGTWRWTVDSAYMDWEFEKGKDSVYHLVVTDPDEGSMESYKLHLVKLENTYYLDIFPNDSKSLMLTELLACHTFGKIEIQDDEIVYYPFDYDWVKELFDHRKIRLRHERPRSNILLTASPKELQKFLIKYGNDEKAYLDPIVLNRPA